MLVYAGYLSGGFYYTGSAGGVQYGVCFERGDVLQPCLSGVAATIASLFIIFVFTFKDFVMCALNSISWMRWMHLTEAIVFLGLTVWWLVNAIVLQSRVRGVIDDYENGQFLINSTAGFIPAPNYNVNSDPFMAMNILVGLQYAIFGNALGCVFANTIWLLCDRYACKGTGNQEEPDAKS